MKNNQLAKSIRLILGAAEAEEAHIEIDPKFIPQIAKARTEMALVRGIDVIDALVMIKRSGLFLALDVRLRTRIMSKERSVPPARN